MSIISIINEILSWIISYPLEATCVLIAVVIIVQFILCFKVKKPICKFIPLFIFGIVWINIILLALGVYGVYNGFFSHMERLAAGILAIVFVPPVLGIGLVWLIYAIVKRHRRKKESIVV